MIKDLKDKYLDIWWETTTEPENKNKRISFVDKFKNEKRIEDFRKQLFRTLKVIPEKHEEENWKNEVFRQIKDIESSVSNYEESVIDFFIGNGYAKITEEFIDEVKRFDPNMSVYDIFQAIRNVWIMNSIQILYDMKVKLTPSIFAYSMLYPYSDNYLDDSSISFEDKIEFNQKFRRWLLGENDNPSNTMENHIYDLVKMIENEFERRTYPEVFDSLLAIHKAQEKSLTQQKEKTLPHEKDIIGVSFEKGGTSVLADAYLVRGQLEKNEAEFMFCYGVLLQIIDDLQDIDEDSQNIHMTIFSQIVGKYDCDRLVNKLMNFINNFFDNETTFISDDANILKKVIRDCSSIMIFEAISKNKSKFGKEYIKDIESYGVVRYSYFKKIKKKFQKTFSSNDIVRICEILSGMELEDSEIHEK